MTVAVVRVVPRCVPGVGVAVCIRRAHPGGVRVLVVVRQHSRVRLDRIAVQVRRHIRVRLNDAVPIRRIGVTGRVVRVTTTTIAIHRSVTTAAASTMTPASTAGRINLRRM